MRVQSIKHITDSLIGGIVVPEHDKSAFQSAYWTILEVYGEGYQDSDSVLIATNRSGSKSGFTLKYLIAYCEIYTREKTPEYFL